MLSHLLVMAAVMILALAAQGGRATDDDVENTKDSLVTDIVTKGKTGRINKLMVLKHYKKEIFLMCIGDVNEHEYFALFYTKKEHEPTLLLILKVESCKEENKDKLAQSIILKSYDSDLTNIEVMVRVRNKGCERYTSVDKRLSPCECRDTQLYHGWIKLSLTESQSMLEEIRSGARIRSSDVQKGIAAASQITALSDPTEMKMQEIVENMDVMQFKSVSNVRKRRGAKKVFLIIIAIPICIIAFIIMAPFCVVWYGVKFAVVGVVGGVELARKGVGKMMGA